MSLALRSGLASAFLVTITECAPVRPNLQADRVMRAPSPLARELSPDEQVAHVLSRLTFGARPGDVERVGAIGVDAWIDAQLKPESISDSGLAATLAPNESWTMHPDDLVPTSTTLNPPVIAPIRRSDAKGNPLPQDSIDTQVRAAMLAISRIGPSADPFGTGKLVHAQIGERQLFEVMADFWENHFSIYRPKAPSDEALAYWDRAAIRPHALGKFRDLLGAVAQSPAMLFYLDNHLSRRGAINENFGREILELHTLGADGGFTQQDVINVGHAFTGWSYAPLSLTAANHNVARVFVFNAAAHDSSAKVVLGHRLAAGRGMEDGEEVLDIIARHPSTAHYIALKLARHLVSDDPPASIVDRAAATFARTDGDIAEVVRTIVTSPEFFSRAAFRAKVKTPFEFMASARRALEAPADLSMYSISILASTFGQPVFGRITPDGWPDRGEAWMTPGAMYNRIKLGSDVASGKLQYFPVERWRGWEQFATEPPDRQASGVVHLLLGGIADAALRDVLLTTDGTASAVRPDAARTRLRDMVAIVIGSPDFQRR